MLYLIGSLRNENVQKIAATIRERCEIEVFDDWQAAGPEADDKWRDYEKARGRTYKQALYEGHAARHVYEYDKRHLDRATMAALIMPSGRSGHLELGYVLGRQKPGFIFTEDPDRWDTMYLFATRVVDTIDELVEYVNRYKTPAGLNTLAEASNAHQ